MNKNILRYIFMYFAILLRQIANIAFITGLTFFFIGCGPHTTNLISHGSDKKQQDDDGYAGTGGTGDGGGGQGIFCATETKNSELRSKLLVRDIFEAVYNSKLNIKQLNVEPKDNTEVTEESLGFLIESLRTYFGPSIHHLEIGKKDYWRKFIQQISFITEEARLIPSQDANSPIALPSGCRITQIAYWDDSTGDNDSGTLYVDKANWEKLDQTNKLALLTHEYFFKMARKSGEKNSDSIRGKVGRMFSIGGAEPLFKNWIQNSDIRAKDKLPHSNLGFKYCLGTSKVDPDAKLIMYQYLGRDGKQHFTFPWISSTLINLNPLQNRELNLERLDDDLIAVSNLLLLGGRPIPYEPLQSNQNTFFNAKSKLTNSGLLPWNPSQGNLQGANPALFLSHLKNRRNNEVWKDSLRSREGVIQISIQNPAHKGSEIKYSTVDLVKVVQNDFIKKIQARMDPVAWSNAQADIINLIRTLNTELGRNKESGIENSEFADFKKLYGTFLEKHVWSKENDSFAEFDRIKEGQKRSEDSEYFYNISKNLPQLLIKASLNLLTREDIVENEIYELMDDSTDLYNFPRVTLNVSLNSKSVDFHMDCNDFNKEFTDSLDAESQLLNSNEVVESDLRYKFLSSKLSKKVQTPRIADAYKSFLEYLAKRAPSPNPAGEYDCATPGPKELEFCRFQKRMATAKLIEVEPCSSRFLRAEDHETTDDAINLCLIISFSEDQSTYILWGSNISPEENTLDFAKHIAPFGDFQNSKDDK